MRKISLLFIILWLMFTSTFAQVFTNKVGGEKNQTHADSLKASEYSWALPIWGAKVTAKGYDIPYSAGVSINYFTQTSTLVLSDLLVGFNNGPMYDLDEIVRFNDAEAWAAAVTIRPDIWLLPFLNVYGILGFSNTSTSISAGVYVPNIDNVWEEIAQFSSVAEFRRNTTMGFGMTPTMGIRNGWLALDMNCAWTDISALDKPVFTYVFGPRFGKTFKLNKPEHNIAIWVGGFMVKFSSETKGSLNLAEVLPLDELQVAVDQGIENVGEKQVAVDDWWAGLTPTEQKNPVNAAKYETANRALGTAGEILNSADAALNDGNSATVQYSLEKNLKDNWNFVIGGQYQLNKHWMLRAEYGFLGSRTQFMAGLQFRFRL